MKIIQIVLILILSAALTYVMYGGGFRPDPSKPFPNPVLGQ